MTAAQALSSQALGIRATPAGVVNAEGQGAVIVAAEEQAQAQEYINRLKLDAVAVTNAEAAALRVEAAAAEQAAAAQSALGVATEAGAGAASEAAAADTALAVSEEEAGAAATGASIGLAALAAPLLELFAVLEVVRGFKDFIETGTQFTATLESARLGIAAITEAYGTLTDAQGRALTGQDALTGALGIADAQLQALQADAVRVAVPFQTLADLFRGVEGAGLKAGASLDQLRQLVTSASLAAAALGTPYEQLNVTLVQLLEGHVRITNQLVAHLGLSTQQVHEWQAQGTLVEHLLETFQKFAPIADQVRSTWRGIGTEIKNAAEIIAGTAIRPALTTLEEGLRDELGEVIDTTTGRVSKSFSGLAQVVGAALTLMAKGLVEGLKAAVEFASELSSWLDRNRATMLTLVSGALSLVEGIGAVVKEALGIVAPLEAAYITSGLVLVPIKAIGYALAGAVDLVHGLGAAFSGAGYLFMNLILTPLDLFLEGLGKAANFVKAGLGDPLLAAAQQNQALLARIAGPAVAMLDAIKSGTTAVQQFGKNWQAAQDDATHAADAIQKAITDMAKAVANFRLNPLSGDGGAVDVPARVQAAIEAAKSAAALQKQYLESALKDNEISYRDYFDELTRTEIASIDKQIAAKQELLAAAPAKERPKIAADIGALENDRIAIRLENETKYRAAIEATNAKVMELEAGTRKAESDAFTARLGEIGKEAEALNKALALEGVSDAERRERVERVVTVRIQLAEVDDLKSQVEQALKAPDAQIKDVQRLVQTHAIDEARGRDLVTAAYQRELAVIDQALQKARELAAVQAQQPGGVAPQTAAEIDDLQAKAQRVRDALAEVALGAQRVKVELAQGVSRDLTTFLTETVEKAHTAGQAFSEFGVTVITTIQKILASLIQARIEQAILGLLGVGQSASSGADAGGSASSGLAGFVAGLAAHGFAGGGMVSGPGGPTDDSVPAMLSAGEYVVPAHAVTRLGADFFDTVVTGARMPAPVIGRQHFAAGGLVAVGPVGGHAAGSGTAPTHLRVELDKGLILSTISSAPGHKVIVDAMQKNPKAVQAALGVPNFYTG